MRRPLLLLLPALGACWVTPAEVRDKLDGSTPTGPAVGIPTGSGTGTGTPSGSATGTGTGTTGGTPTGTTTADFSCVDEDIGSAVGDNATTGDTTGAGNDEQGACFGAGGPTSTGNDLVFQWEAPNSGCFAFDTSAASFDTVLYVFEGDCNGAEVGCNDDYSDAVNTSEVGVQAIGGMTYLVVVDGYDAGDNGAYQLDIHPTNAIVVDQDLGNAPGSYNGSNVGADDTLDPAACFYNSGSDVIYRFTAPSSAAWTFRLEPFLTDFDSALSLHRQCTSDALLCSDVVGLGGESATLSLYGGEEILIRVAGYTGATGTDEGNYTLVIEN